MLRKLFLVSAAFIAVALLASFKNKEISIAKAVQQNFAKVNDNLYACKYEVSNLEYRIFLTALRAKDVNMAEKYKVDTAKWVHELRYQEPMAIYYHSHPAYNSYPVVCISYESAQAYCDWLTEQYNADEKRKFKNVKFVLPTEEEWMMAANGGNKNRMYPWGSYYLRNKTGEFLCNFKHIGDAFIVSDDHGNPKFDDNVIEKVASGLNDASLYTASVKSFWPNAFGIYNMSGNAAEMTMEKGLTKGGSWNSYGGEVTIQSKKTYNQPSPEVGFRVFMKIIPGN